MASFVDLEDEDLIDADENDLYDTIDQRGDEDVDENQDNGLVPEEAADGENGLPDDADPAAGDVTSRTAPKKRVVKNPQPKLNADRLKGPRGLIILEEWFKDIKYKGKRYEKEDLDAVMSRLEQWTNRLFPKFTFDDSLARIESLGHKKEVVNYVRRIRLGMEDGYGGAVTNEDIDDPDDPDDPAPVQEVDPFDSLLNAEPMVTSTQANQTQTATLTDEQRERMIRNRLLAEEKRLARAKQRLEEQARQQKEAEEIAAAVAASQALDDDDFFPTNVSQNDSTPVVPNDFEQPRDEAY